LEELQGFIIRAQLSSTRVAFPRWWKTEEETTQVYLVRDGDLPRTPHPYYRLRYRVYASPFIEHASIWRYEKACETYLEKHGIQGVVKSIPVYDTEQIATDGRKIFAQK
tara:strand:+ start:4038 stop:4364 length:327 start_codon:yes stop_codon:yes gene_type:complete